MGVAGCVGGEVVVGFEEADEGVCGEGELVLGATVQGREMCTLMVGIHVSDDADFGRGGRPAIGGWFGVVCRHVGHTG